MVAPRIYPCFAASRLIEGLADTPVVLVHGPRQRGKTTLARTSGEPKGYAYFSFDDDVALAAAEADPVGFVGDLPDRAILDEVQRVPGLFHALKTAVDRRRAPGRFILTGSTNVLLLPKLADSLAGRMEILRLIRWRSVSLPAAHRGSWIPYSRVRSRPGDSSALAGSSPSASLPAAIPPRWPVSRSGGARHGTATTSKPWCSVTCETWLALAHST